MWHSRTKIDLIIEVWEKLDCESVGAAEIEAIEEAVSGQFGRSAVDSPMQVARLLADEGAVLRHREIMDLWVRRSAEIPYEAEFRNLVKLNSLTEALTTIRNAENLRRKFVSGGDREGERLLREEFIDAKQGVLKKASDRKADDSSRQTKAEIAEWLILWLQSPELFENWIKLRKRSPEFINRFGETLK